MSCAVALSVIRVVEEEKLRENATAVGEFFMNNAQKLKKKHEVVGGYHTSNVS